MNQMFSASGKKLLSVILSGILLLALAPVGAFAAREGQTKITPVDTDKNGKTDHYEVDWDGDGVIDEYWQDIDEDGVIDGIAFDDGGDDTRSPRGRVGMRVGQYPLSDGGVMIAIDWDGDGKYDEVWWDFDGDGDIDDTDIYETESKVLDNTKATRFRGVFVGVKNGLDYPEKDVEDITGALGQYGSSWDSADMNKLKGAAATPAAIETAINAAKADSKPGDEFLFYFSGHGGGYDKDDGLSGGRLDTNGDETAIKIPESEFGRFDGSGLATGSPGMVRFWRYDLDGDGTEDTRVVKDEHGKVHVWRPNPGAPPPWIIAGSDTDGDGDVDGDDGGVDINGDGDKNDKVGVDDTILVAGNQKVTDDQLTQWLSGFPESVTIVVILDSCYSGSFIPDLKNNLKDKDGKPLRPGHLEVITAAPADDVAYEMPVSNGVLTQGILNALIKMPAAVTGGHSTSLADHIGDEDDRTTTRELFRWAGANAVTYMNYDNDGDGLRNEDPPEHVVATSTPSVGTIETPPGDPIANDIVHLNEDDDGDGLVDEDPPVPPESFFDVYYDPDFGGWPTPTFIQVFTGDDSLSATGMQPDFGLWSEEGLAPGTAMTPGPTYEVHIREVPSVSEPDPPPGMAFCGGVFDVSLFEVEQSHDLETATETVAPSDLRVPIEGPMLFPNLFGSIAPDEGSNPGDPFYYDESSHEWVALPPLEVDPDSFAVTFPVEHLSQFALIGPPPGRPSDTTPPDDPWRLEAVATGDDVSLAWSNPTDPDHAGTRLLRSSDGYAENPGDSSGQTTVADSRKPFAKDNNLDNGIYFYTAFAYDQAGNWSGRDTAWVKVGDAHSTEVAGTTRYRTAVEASKDAFPTTGSLPKDPEGYRSVVVATGMNWPDALGGSALAGAVGGPILLVGNTVPSEVSKEIQRLGANRVLLLGGTVAVSTTVEAALDAIPGVGKVERIAGADRYRTAEAVAARAVDILPAYEGMAIIATGLTFPDALAGSPLAAGEGWPIYLSAASGLKGSTVQALKNDGVTDAVIMGGPSAVPDSVQTDLESRLSGDVDRLAGKDRYATAVAVADYAIDTVGMRWDGVAVSTGQNFPDALAGGVMQGLDGSVVLLTKSDSLSYLTRNALNKNAYRISEVRFLGGTAAVSDTVRSEVMKALE